MNFHEYKKQYLDLASLDTVDNNQKWRNLLELISTALKQYLGFDTLALSPEDDESCPFDLWGISHKTLYLIKVDDFVFQRGEETIGPNDLGEIFKDFVEFVRRASNTIGFSDRKNTRAIIAELISELAHGDTDRDVERLKLMPFVLNPIDSQCLSEKSLRFQLLKCSAQPLSLQTLWQEGINLPESLNISSYTEQDSALKINNSSLTGEGDLRQIDEDFEATNAESYRLELLSRSREARGLSTYNLFESIIQLLTDVGQYEEISEAHCYKRKYQDKVFSVDGYYTDELNNAWTLFLLDPEDEGNFSKADVDKYSKQVLNFIELSCKDTFYDEIFDVSTEEGSLSYSLFTKSHSKEISRFEIVILTMRKKSFKNNPQGSFCVGIPCRIKILDYNDLFQMSDSLNSQQIYIDFTDKQFGNAAIPLISAINRPDIGYQAYVGKIRADVLASIYEEFGQKVLSSNVRAFLLTQGKVNKGIQKTIKEEPDNFFAFNNGICVVASSINQEDRYGITLMNGIRDFQIVNGGQTTASLHYAKQKKVPIENIFVPIKLSVVPENSEDFDRERFVQKISAYANSQNKVNDSDLGTNTEFQILFQKMGEKAMIVSHDGTVCKWFYERARGTYRIEKLRTKKGYSKTQLFTKHYPEKFDKIELAKWIKAWSNEPYIANLGGQKCFIDFSKDLCKKEECDGIDFCTVDFFKYSVGKGILFRHIDLHVLNSSWYQQERSYKINIVGYTMGLLRLVLMKMFPEHELDFLRFWKEQRIPSAMDKMKTFDPMCSDIAKILDPVIDLLARHARQTFDSPDRTNSDVGEWVKRIECWKMMSETIPDLQLYRSSLKSLCCPVIKDYQIRSWREK